MRSQIPGSLRHKDRRTSVQRLPKSLHSRLAARAKQEGVSMNALVTAIIAESLGKRGSHP
jgi:antitoxin HicB